VAFGERLLWPNRHFRHRNLGLAASPLQMGSLWRNWAALPPLSRMGYEA
jgi:hypothetical protein